MCVAEPAAPNATLTFGSDRKPVLKPLCSGYRESDVIRHPIRNPERPAGLYCDQILSYLLTAVDRYWCAYVKAAVKAAVSDMTPAC